MHQAMAVGVEAIPIVSLISFFVGVILALQGAYELRKLRRHAIRAPTPWRISITRELGPLMTAIIVIGRSGSAFAAEIGTMKVNEEIDALETMALDPVRFLVAPKFLAMMLMMPCLTTLGRLHGRRSAAASSASSARASPGVPTSSATLDALVNARHHHRPDQERDVRHGDHRRGLPGRFPPAWAPSRWAARPPPRW